MEPEEKKFFDSIELISNKKTKMRISEIYPDNEFSSLKKFWKNHDPVKFTEYNERLIEHYTRVAYVNLRFSKPEKGIKGWQTEPGNIYTLWQTFNY